jgi:hypothetical protein
MTFKTLSLKSKKSQKQYFWQASTQVLEQLRKGKSIYAQWVNIGKSQNHPLKQQVISEKRNLRRQQRLEQAIA